MDFFSRLEHLIASQDALGSSPAEVLAEVGSPSTSIAILDHGSITSKCISTIGDDAKTLFQACSISKSITGLATMRLVQQGKLKLDDKIVDVLPEHVVQILETPKTKELLKEITVSQIMSHTSGLCVSGVPGYSKDPPSAEAMLSGKAPANTLHVRVEGLPGHMFSYSGGGMTVLQIILETVAGKDFPSLVKELVLEPLEMTRSCYSLPSGEKNAAEAYFTGYTQCDVPWHTIPEKAAAGLWTTPTDLLKAVRGMQRSLQNTDGETFLGREIAREMLTEVQSTFALTWVAPNDPGIAFGHGGSNFPGWECFLMGYADLHWNSKQGDDKNPFESCGISVMTNSMNGFTVWAKVFHAISYLKKWPMIPSFGGRTPIGKIPFCDYSVEIDRRWNEWKGAWLDGEKHLVLEADGEGTPILRFGESVRARLVPGVISSLQYSDGRRTSIDLVLDGLEIMIRLGWKGGKRGVELWHGAFARISVLEAYEGP